MEVIKFVIVLVAVAAASVCADTLDCAQQHGLEGHLSCRAFKALSNLEDLSLQQNIDVIPGISLTSETPRAMRSGKSLDFPVEAEKRITKLFDMMYSVLNNFFSGRTLKVKFPEDAMGNLMRSMDEGRAKVKKMNPIFLAIGAKLVALVPILLGGLALAALKAVVVAKIAFVIAIILAIKTFGSSEGGFLGKFGGGQAYNQAYAPSWNAGSSWNQAQAYPYARSSEETQNIVYSAQKP